MSTKELKAQAMKLPAKHRADLARRLLESLDDEKVDPECERLWLDEAERRYRKYKQGRSQLVSVAQAFREARARAR